MLQVWLTGCGAAAGLRPCFSSPTVVGSVLGLVTPACRIVSLDLHRRPSGRKTREGRSQHMRGV